MRLIFAVLFAASGAAALVYEVTWTRLLTLELGHGVAAASTVLAAFMGGLAVGAAVAARVSTQLSPQRALRVYAGLELAIALLALVLPYEIRALDPLLRTAYADGAGGTTFALLRLAAGLLLLSVPAAAMGATFPIAARWFVQHATRAARDAGALYSANTVGAALGAIAAGFVLLPRLGLSRATWVGVLLNVIAAGGALWISRRAATAAPPPPAPAPASKAAHGFRRSARRAPVPEGRPALAALALGVSGFVSLTLQVVWTRLLALVLGPTTYAFSTMVAVFVAGLAAGAAIGSRLAMRVKQPAAGLAAALALSAAGVGLSATLIDTGLLSIASLVAQPEVTFGQVLARQALIAVGLLAPMTVALGLAFPFAVAVATRSDATVSRDLGLIYAVNTVGAIAGALVAGFVLISWLGLHGTIRAVMLACAAGAAAVLWIGTVTGRVSVFGVAAVAGLIIAAVWLPPWDRLLLSSGAYKYAASMRGPDLHAALRAGRLLYYREGPTGTVAVRRLTGATSLAIDGKVDASNAGDMLTQRLLAHVPLLLHDRPRRVAILGLGSGVTLGSALTHPIVRADVLEISPEVVEASRFFEAENHRALHDPRTRLIVGDGRSHLLLTREHYDVIVSEPSNPWMAGIASLFTREFFAAARARLAPGGILCQWAHTYDISTADLRSIAATFLSVFPEGTLWLIGDGDVLLIGSNTAVTDRLASVAGAWERPGVHEDLASVGATEPFHVLSLFLAGPARLHEWTTGAPIQTDDRAELEFSGPQSIVGTTREDNAVLLRQLAARPGRPPVIEESIRSASAASWRDRGQMLLEAEAFRPAFDDFAAALRLDPHDAAALDGLLRAAVPAERVADARTVLAQLAGDPANHAARIVLSRLLAAEGEFNDAVRVAFGLVQANPDSVPALEQMASILSDAGDKERMAPIVARLRAIAPGSESAHYYSAALLFLEGRTELALREARIVVARNPRHAKAQNLLGACLASLGQREQARAAFRASIEADPKQPATYTNLATLELEAGNPAQAAEYFAEALIIDPTSQAAREGLLKAGG